MLKQRIRKAALHKKIVEDPQSLVPLFKDGMNIGWSGFSFVGCPKIVPKAVADHVESNKLQGQMKFSLFAGASTGEEEDRWARLGMLDRRYPFQEGKNIAAGINSKKIRFHDTHLSKFPDQLHYGYYTNDKELDIAVIEATAITEEGHIVPSASVGVSPLFTRMSEKIIVELNTEMLNFEGMHDIVTPEKPPLRHPLNLYRVHDRIGRPAIPVDPDRIVAIVESKQADQTHATTKEMGISNKIAAHIINFLNDEIARKRLTHSLMPLQSGVGNIANAVIEELASGPYHRLQVWSEVLQDSFLDFFDSEKLLFASSAGLHFSPAGFERFYNNWTRYIDKIILRPQYVSNSPELISRLGVIAMNTPLEFDIYGHANSTMACGSRIVHGIGGSGDFMRHAKISIMHCPASRPSKTDPTGISSVVPMVSHVDHTEHDIDILCTEQGLADLRGLSPRERSREIIEKCAHPDYKDILVEYTKLADKYCEKHKAQHMPHMLSASFKMHQSLLENGTMKIKNWN